MTESMAERNTEPERPRRAEARIEGRVQSTFVEIPPDQMQPVPLHDITWGDTTLAFQEVERHSIPVGIFGMEMPVILYTGQLKFDEGEADLSETTTGKPVLFTGTRNGFYAYDSTLAGRHDPFYVVGVQPDELEANISRLSSVYHELGHALLFDTNLDAQVLQAAMSLRKKDLPAVSMAEEYAKVIARWIPDHSRSGLSVVARRDISRIETAFRGTEKGMSLFGERNAWAAGMHVARTYGSPTGFDNPHSYFVYARLCLSTYASFYRDDRFVRGFK